MVREPEGWDITIVENDKKKALDLLNEAARADKQVHYVEAMAIKVRGPDLGVGKGYRWDY